VTRESYLKHKDLIEAWANGAEIEALIGDNWEECTPSWNEDRDYCIKQVEPKKKTIVLETWLMKDLKGLIYTIEAETSWITQYALEKYRVKLLSTREVEIDE